MPVLRYLKSSVGSIAIPFIANDEFTNTPGSLARTAPIGTTFEGTCFTSYSLNPNLGYARTTPFYIYGASGNKYIAKPFYEAGPYDDGQYSSAQFRLYATDSDTPSVSELIGGLCSYGHPGSTASQHGSGITWNSAAICYRGDIPYLCGPAGYDSRDNYGDVSFGGSVDYCYYVLTYTHAYSFRVEVPSLTIPRNALIDIIAAATDEPIPFNPYEPGGYIDPEGETGPGSGEWELPQDELAVGGSNYNDLTAGLFRAYAMTASQLNDFSNQLWNTSIIDAISRYYQNPADLVMGLMSFPFDVDSGSATQIGFNWLDAWGLTSIVVYGHPISDGRPQPISFGYIQIPQYSGTFYDYGPYSTVEIHLPYIGFVPMKMNEVVGRKVYVDYYVDVFTGDFTAHLSVGGSELNPEGLPIMAVYQGNIGKPLPLTQQNMWQVYKKIGETATAAVIASGGAMIGAGASMEADRYSVIAKESKEKIGKVLGAEDVESWASDMSSQFSNLSETGYKTAVRSGLAGTANAILNMQSVNAPIVRNGSVDGSNGRTSSQECFAIISTPDQNVPSNQGILGYPSNIPGPLSKVHGYTEVREIRLASSIATLSELSEIEEIVRGGIIV